MIHRRWSWSGTLDLLSIAFVVAVVSFWGAGWVRRSSNTMDGRQVVMPDAPLPEGSLSASEFFSLASTGRWIGNREAPAVLLVYSSYTCGFCREFFAGLETLQARYPDHLAIVVKHIADPALLGREDLVPAMAAECAGEQERFADLHFAAFRNTSVLRYSEAAMTLADVAGIPDRDRFRLCVQSERFRGVLVDQAAEANRLGVTGTPTSFLNGLRIIGAVPMDDLDALIALRFPGRSAAAERRKSLAPIPD